MLQHDDFSGGVDEYLRERRRQRCATHGAAAAFVIVIVAIALCAAYAKQIGAAFGARPSTPAGGAGAAYPTKFATDNRMIGYYYPTISSGNCTSVSQLTPETVQAHLYTHLIYSFSPPVSLTTWVLEDPSEAEANNYRAFNALKRSHPLLTTMLSVGGDIPSVAPMSQMSADASRRQTFAKATVEFARRYGFDGLDFDWEFPGDTSRGGSTNDPESFAALMRAMREAIDSEVLSDGQSRLVLSTIVPGGPGWGKNYRVPETVAYVDWINILGYNVLGTWQPYTGCSAALHNADKNGDSQAAAIAYFLDQANSTGHGPGKFNLGLSFWGIAYALKTPVPTGQAGPAMNAPAYTGAQKEANAGCTRQPGYLAYFEIHDIVSKKQPVVQLDTVQQCEYFTYDADQFVAYDDAKTLVAKIDYAFSLGLKGVSIWGIDADSGDHKLTSAVFNRVESVS